ncbi:hypothetical protein FISHEDRAFT_74536 [Fistulina hepatica ATCC 64428]|uniref:Uncharacterized protein n=1 Tax=Fistulina hepatica ATCC 64428 TaxID=1128425 RepID=A0A0D7A9U1_9AGAR|nr:hypothetical protein FISHEDRAFT_74536 [Fistulina hepatica ATCC 64428]
MFVSTVRAFAARVPLIKFIGKRTWPAVSEAHAHPAAPAEYQKTFEAFLKRRKDALTSLSSSTSSGAPAASVVDEFWEAPERFWHPKIRELQEWEIEAIATGGASLH